MYINYILLVSGAISQSKKFSTVYLREQFLRLFLTQVIISGLVWVSQIPSHPIIMNSSFS